MLAASLQWGAGPAAAQSTSAYTGEIKADPVRLIQAGETLHVEMDIVLVNVKVHSAAGVDLIPLLVSADHTLELPRISIKGRNEYLAYERMLSLLGRNGRNTYDYPYTVEKAYRTGSRTIAYRYALPFEPWMKDARLELQRDEIGCGDLLWMTADRIADSVTLETHPVPYRVIPTLAFVQPQAEVKTREKQVETFLDFVVNKTDIRPDYMNNPAELAKIHALIDELHGDADITITRLDIIGYASPEGSLENNRRLSEGRANALKNYLASKYNFPPSLYYTVFGGENWDGLRRALTSLDAAYKDEVLNIVNYYEGQDRKNRLARLQGGQPYRWLLQNVYPSLRVAVCRVEYTIKNFNLEEARQVFRVRPQNLSLNEMYLVANSYPNGSQEFIDVFETAVRLYPEDDVARLNAAASALSRNDADTGERYLSQVENKQLPQYLNAAGVLALLQGDYETAGKYLNQAVAAGLDAARSNLEELEKKKANALELNERK